jgi:hypothetical protein
MQTCRSDKRLPKSENEKNLKKLGLVKIFAFKAVLLIFNFVW